MIKIAIRADGGSKIGLGHIMRTLVLARELAKTNVVFYVCKKDNPLTAKYINGIEKVRSEGFQVIIVDEDNIIIELSKIEADCLITDSYDVDEEYFNKTKKMFSKTGYIDDMNLYYYNVDFIINHNIYANKSKYKCNEDTLLFLGTEYIILREEFRDSKPNQIKKNIKNILVTMGGADPNNFTLKLLKYIKDLEYNINVVIGPAFTDIDKIELEIKNRKNIKLSFNTNMIEMMKECDIAISATGSTLYELTTLGIPTLGVILVDNQEGIAKEMNKHGFIINLGWYDKVEKNDVLDAINRINDFDLRKNMITKAIKRINKDGVEKLYSGIEKIFSYLI